MAANSSALKVMCSYGQNVQCIFGLQHHYIVCNSQIEQEVVECLRQVSLPQGLNGHHVLAFRCGNCGQRPVNTTDMQLDYKYNYPGFDVKVYAIYI
jgi:ribosomal protein S27E